MALFIDFNDPGLIIYTSHRQIHIMPVNTIEELKDKLKNLFEITENIEDVKVLNESSYKILKRYLCIPSVFFNAIRVTILNANLQHLKGLASYFFRFVFQSKK